ncbi:MAG: 3-methyl-2-oxobutanoate hydroxymethyltransferase, partial [Gallionellaceae bacterium]|nr:3-methyl-2-oxobutanoate hydroxymethyltransferase [Gallionellaceae bacterium]
QLKACATIGIGAGPDCDGQVLVLHDMLGVYPGKKGRFVKDFMAEAQSIDGAVKSYVAAVKGGSFPSSEHTY